jgi:hypothetical protein
MAIIFRGAADDRWPSAKTGRPLVVAVRKDFQRAKAASLAAANRNGGGVRFDVAVAKDHVGFDLLKTRTVSLSTGRNILAGFMETKPFFMRTKREIEQILPADSAQREQALKSLEHSFSLYDYAGNHKPHPYEKENLLELIGRREMYVVDNNSPWQSECKSHLDKAFIISAALSREQPRFTWARTS